MAKKPPNDHRDNFEDSSNYDNFEGFDDELIEDPDDDEWNYDQFLESEFGNSGPTKGASWRKFVILVVLLAFTFPLLIQVLQVISGILYRP